MSINWYKRGDGVLFSAESGSVMDDVLKRDGSFVRCTEDGEQLTQQHESETDTEQPNVEGSPATGDAGQGGAAVGSGAGDRDQADNAAGNQEESAGRKNVPPTGDNQSGNKAKSGNRAKKVKEK